MLTHDQFSLKVSRIQKTPLPPLLTHVQDYKQNTKRTLHIDKQIVVLVQCAEVPSPATVSPISCDRFRTDFDCTNGNRNHEDLGRKWMFYVKPPGVIDFFQVYG